MFVREIQSNISSIIKINIQNLGEIANVIITCNFFFFITCPFLFCKCYILIVNCIDILSFWVEILRALTIFELSMISTIYNIKLNKNSFETRNYSWSINDENSILTNAYRHKCIPPITFTILLITSKFWHQTLIRIFPNERFIGEK